jgi:SP family arabinose:H+ symporter-like MFS transporter
LLQPGLRRALSIAVTIAILQQMTGVSPITFYMPIVFQDAGFRNPSDAIMQTIFVNLWSMVWTLLAFWLVDRVGRRPLLMVGTLGMGIGMILMGLFFYMRVSGIYVVLAMMFSMAFYVISLAPLAWLMMSEIFPTHLRGTGMAVSSAFLWLATFFSTQMLPSLTAFIQNRFGSSAGVFWIFAAICVGAFFFSRTAVPETKGKSLEEIGRSWNPDDLRANTPS